MKGSDNTQYQSTFENLPFPGPVVINNYNNVINRFGGVSKKVVAKLQEKVQKLEEKIK
jgi:hypothetical protein